LYNSATSDLHHHQYHHITRQTCTTTSTTTSHARPAPTSVPPHHTSDLHHQHHHITRQTCTTSTTTSHVRPAPPVPPHHTSDLHHQYHHIGQLTFTYTNTQVTDNYTQHKFIIILNKVKLCVRGLLPRGPSRCALVGPLPVWFFIKIH